ncbi:MAG: magnesium transporter [Candidatus Manganitrophus sp.]|nr:MAG: magnesium transporter [Candidatus Manganitrophus sp.]
MQPRQNHHAETAEQHLVTRIPTAQIEEEVGAVIARLPEKGFDTLEAVYIVDEKERLQGFLPLSVLFATRRHRRLREVMAPPPPAVHADVDQERVVGLAVRHNLTAVPVVGLDRRLLGVVPAQALLQILRREHVEDLHRLAGIRRETASARNAMEAPPIRRTRDRLPWLLVGLIGSFIATFIMSRFEGLLSARVAVSFFVPGIVYLADAIGTQTEAVAVRGLSLSHLPLRQLLGSELRTGFLIGLSLAGFSVPAIWLAFGDFPLALAVGLAIITAGTIATTVGLFFPWLLSRLGKDPAFGSGPTATILQDVLSILIYFVIVETLLP